MYDNRIALTYEGEQAITFRSLDVLPGSFVGEDPIKRHLFELPLGILARLPKERARVRPMPCKSPTGFT
jgi:hypothetical protein